MDYKPFRLTGETDTSYGVEYEIAECYDPNSEIVLPDKNILFKGDVLCLVITCKNLIVKGDQTVKGNLIVKGDQTVKGNQIVEGYQRVEGNQIVEGNQRVDGYQTVKGIQRVEAIYLKSFCKWPVKIHSNLDISIGCKRLSVTDWDVFFENKQFIETFNTESKEYKMIVFTYEYAKSSLPIMQYFNENNRIHEQ